MGTPVKVTLLFLHALGLILGFFKVEPEIQAYTEWLNQKYELNEQR